MFTGIIQAVGVVKSWSDGVLLVDPLNMDLDHLNLGESISVDGVCLTVVSYDNQLLRFDLSPETVQISSFREMQEGSSVNLERAMALGDRLGGHIVQGHVDGVGTFVSRKTDGNSTIFSFRVPHLKYAIEKGSITVNGISLTIVNLKQNEFDIWVIPHTLEKTNLARLTPGQSVNIEFDMIAKYVERLMSPLATNS